MGAGSEWLAGWLAWNGGEVFTGEIIKSKSLSMLSMLYIFIGVNFRG